MRSTQPVVMTLAVLLLATFTLTACHSKKERDREFIPLGYYATRVEAQALTGRLNADLAKSKAQEKAQGVPEKDLPRGRYKVVSTRNSDGREFLDRAT